MMKTCAKCGKELPPQVTQGRPRTKCEDCSPRRVRPDRAVAIRSIGPAVVTPDLQTVESATRIMLADVLDHPQAAIALRLARRLDAEQDSGTGMKALQQSHNAACEIALSSRKGASNALDELRRQRERRIGIV